MDLKDLSVPMLNVSSILNKQSSCCTKSRKSFMRKLHNIFDWFGTIGKTKSKHNIQIVTNKEIVLRDIIEYDEL